jgi:hypothetical protein
VGLEAGLIHRLAVAAEELAEFIKMMQFLFIYQQHTLLLLELEDHLRIVGRGLMADLRQLPHLALHIKLLVAAGARRGNGVLIKVLVMEEVVAGGLGLTILLTFPLTRPETEILLQ